MLHDARESAMFKIGQIVVTRNSGVCDIVRIEAKTFRDEEKDYYILQPHFSDSDETTIIYIPVANGETSMREPLNEREVLDLIDSMPRIEKLWYSDPKIRRVEFEKIYRLGDIRENCRIVKSLYLQSQELKQTKRTLSMIDREFLIKMQKDIYEEFAVALGIAPDGVQDFIDKRLNLSH